MYDAEKHFGDLENTAGFARQDAYIYIWHIYAHLSIYLSIYIYICASCLAKPAANKMHIYIYICICIRILSREASRILQITKTFSTSS